MATLNIGIVGGGYMGKAHASAFASVGTVFETRAKPILHSVCGSNPASSKRYAQAYGFAKAATNWQSLVDDPQVQAIIIASPQETHRPIAEAALALGKPVLCEKPLGASLADAQAMTLAANSSGAVNMIGFNYMKTPVTQHALAMVKSGALGEIVSFRACHTEDFLAGPTTPGSWRTNGPANGNMGDLAPHIVNHALQFMGPIREVMADISTVHTERPDGAGGMVPVTNDDQATLLCHFEHGVCGTLHCSRIATGKKMGIEYEIAGTEGALRFDQEDQNALWYYDASNAASERGFRRILAGPEHPDYVNFCLGPGHGTGYLDQIIIQAAAFLRAVDGEADQGPDFAAGLAVSKVIDAAWRSHEAREWVAV
ncbi:MAG: Gfo/Idh/MocA family oxidoreductase [Ahrensia sp.]|nr:Gfo/Idh/MocA family oxidoreductase [Ahrensia sp.]